MGNYLYRVRDESGRTLYGITEADHVRNVRKQFRGGDFLFVSAVEYDIKKASRIAIPFDDLLMFTQRLASLIGGGIPMLSALSILWKQSETRQLQIIVSFIRKKIEEGGTIHDAMTLLPGTFSLIYVSMIRAAEAGSGLDIMLKRIANDLQQQKKFSAKVKRATMYPSFVLGFAFLVMIGLFLFVVPAFQKVLFKMNTDLPLLSRVLFDVSDAFHNVSFLSVAALGVAGLFILYKQLVRIPRFRYMVDAAILRVPYLGKIYFLLAVGRFARVLGLLVQSGIVFLDAIDVARVTLQNKMIERALDDITSQVNGGITLYDAFKSTKSFPILMTEMIGIGEATGKLGQQMECIADHFDEEVDYMLYRFITFLEPVSIIFVGGFVLVVMLGIYLPVFSLQGVLRSM